VTLSSVLEIVQSLCLFGKKLLPADIRKRLRHASLINLFHDFERLKREAMSCQPRDQTNDYRGLALLSR
jgi:hypothetical protein